MHMCTCVCDFTEGHCAVHVSVEVVLRLHEDKCIIIFIVTFSPVENRVLRSEHIIMGTSGTVLDWILKRKVCTVKFTWP